MLPRAPGPGLCVADSWRSAAVRRCDAKGFRVCPYLAGCLSVQLLDPRIRKSKRVRPVAERAMEGDFLQFQVGQYFAREMDAARNRLAPRRAQQPPQTRFPLRPP